MIYYEDKKIIIRDSEFKDVLLLGPCIAADEVEEMRGFFDLSICSPTDVLCYSFFASHWSCCMESVETGAVMAMCGIGDWGTDDCASVWLLSSCDLQKHRISLVRRGSDVFLSALTNDGRRARCLVGVWLGRTLGFLAYLGFVVTAGPFKKEGRSFVLVERGDMDGISCRQQ